MATLYCFAARCLFGVVFLHKAKQGRWLCAVSAYKSLPHQRTAHRFTRHESAKSLRPGQSLIFSPRHGHCVVFCVNFFWKCLVLGNLTCAQDPRSASVLRGERDHFIYAHPLDNSKHRSRANGRLSEGRKSNVLSCNIDYPDPMTGPGSRSPRNT